MCAAACGPAGCLAEPSRLRTEREVHELEARPWADPGRVIAEVNGRPLTRGEYYQRVLKKFGSRTVLSGIIKEELFVQEAKRRSIAVDAGEVAAKVAEMLAAEAARAGGEAELEKIYRKQGLSLADLREDYRRDVESHLLVGKVTRALRAIDEPALRSYYQETYSRTRYRVRHIPYTYPLRGAGDEELSRRKLLALEKAERTVKRIREGADFAQIARQESEDSTRESGGDIGYVSQETPMDPVMKEAVLRLKPGEVSDPVENTLFGAYHVVQVTEVVPHQSFAECEARMKRELAEREPDLDEIQKTLDALYSRSRVKVFGEVVEPEASPEVGRADPGLGEVTR
jgi:parvulin-like peptidyl-prolyl isomerase